METKTAEQHFFRIAREWQLPSDWKFRFNRRVRDLGLCNYRKKTIYLSIYYIMEASDADVINTIKHEIAHALMPQGEGHGARWRALFLQMGGNGKRCTDVHIMTAKKPFWVISCANGCWETGYFWKKEPDKSRHHCATCRGKILWRRA